MSVEISNRLLEQLVESILRSLYIPGTLKGMKYLTYAVTATVIDPNRTYLITKDLYREIARQYDTTPDRVERDIRWAIQTSWKVAKEELCQIADCHLTQCPTNKQYIDLIAFYIRSR